MVPLWHTLKSCFPHLSHQSPYHVHSNLAHHCVPMLLSEGFNSCLLLRYQIAQYIFQILETEKEELKVIEEKPTGFATVEKVWAECLLAFLGLQVCAGGNGELHFAEMKMSWIWTIMLT